MNKDLRKLVKALEAQGFEVTPTRNGHYLVTFGGDRVCTIAGTPSDHRAWKNTLAALKRAGFLPFGR